MMRVFTKQAIDQFLQQLKLFRWPLLASSGLLAACVVLTVQARQANRSSLPPIPAANPVATTTTTPLPLAIPGQETLSAPASPTASTKRPAATAPATKQTHAQTPVAARSAQRPAPAPQFSAPKSTKDIEIRVAIQQAAQEITVGTSIATDLYDAQGNFVGHLPAMEASPVVVDGQVIRFGSRQAVGAMWVMPKEGFVYVNDRWYRGRLLLLAEGNQLTAVNYVELEPYLYSVVGSEMPAGWSLEALKAQAVAARSYALAHHFRPASRWFDLGNTERWQVYGGIQTEWSSTHAAVNTTRGQVLTYGGGLVETLYAASDDIVKKVFDGLGMSQQGAQTLASQGYNYYQILGNFYPGTGLAQLQVR